MEKVVDFETGVRRIYEAMHRFEKPVLVSVHSPGRNHGKSTLIRRLMRELSQNGMNFTSDAYSEIFTHADSELVTGYDGHLLDIGGVAGPKLSREIVNNSTLKTFGKALDYSVFIYNPKIDSSPDISGLCSVMDLIVINPNSAIKEKTP